MSVITCIDGCEEHGIDFPHRVVNAGIRKTNEGRIYTFLIICAFCGHWIDRPYHECKCPASCHMEARSGEPRGTFTVMKKLSSLAVRIG